MKKLMVLLGVSLFANALLLTAQPKPTVTPISLGAISGSMSCSTGATLFVDATLKGGSLGGGGKINVLDQAGVKLGSTAVTIGANKTSVTRVNTTLSGCTKANSLLVVEFIPDGSGTTSSKFLSADVVSFKEGAETPP